MNMESEESEIFEFLNSEKIITNVLSLLESENSNIIINSMIFIQNLLYYGIQEMSRLSSSVNPIVSIINKGGYEKVIENLQNNCNKEIGELATEVFDKFLD